jgi:hypothetical protein
MLTLEFVRTSEVVTRSTFGYPCMYVLSAWLAECIFHSAHLDGCIYSLALEEDLVHYQPIAHDQVGNRR